MTPIGVKLGRQFVPIAGGGVALRPVGATGNSQVTGGAFNLDNTNATGAGIVAYTNRGADATGALVSIRVDNAANAQRGLSHIYKGATHGAFFDHQGVGSSSIGINLTSINDADTALGISGRESGRGTFKDTHFKPDGIADGNSSTISLVRSRVNGSETSASQFLFGDSDHAIAVTTYAMQLRNNGAKFWGVYTDGTMEGLKIASGSDPAAPASGLGKVYFRDNGSGKCQFVARFPTGAVQVMATEP